MPLPAGAELFERDGVQMARWRLRNGKVRKAEVVPGRENSAQRVRGRSAFYHAKYRDAAGRVIEASTGCRDETAARAFLLQLQRRTELVRAGVLTDAEGDAAGHAAAPLARHFDAYERHLHAKNGDPRRIAMLRKRLERLARECGSSRLSKTTAAPAAEWLADQADAGMAAATRNVYRESLVCFANWRRRTRRLTSNPFLDLPRADQNGDRRRQRRALTEAELGRLLRVASLRPLAEYGREIVERDREAKPPARSHATWTRRALASETIAAAVGRAREALEENPAFIAQLERTGRERALMYKTLVLTGLRKSELASLTVGQLNLGGPVAAVMLNAAHEKNRQGATIPLREDLADGLQTWLHDRLAALQAQCGASGQPIPARLPAITPLFQVPSGLARILDRDLAAAGIPKRDERGRVVDVHALRVTFGTHLCAAGVPLRTAQAAMRHSKPELTANIYTDPKLLDIAGAIRALPPLPLAEPAPARVPRAGP